MKKIDYTEVRKDPFNNWHVESVYQLTEKQFLRIITTKRASGYLVTSATVSEKDGTAWVHRVPDDFSEVIVREQIRGTKKACEMQHDRVDLKALEEKVRAFYKLNESSELEKRLKAADDEVRKRILEVTEKK